MTCVLFFSVRVPLLSLWSRGHRTYQAYISSMQVTARTQSHFLTAGLWLPYKAPYPGLYKKKKTQILTLFHWTNYRGSFCGDCHTVPLLCSSTSLPSCGILYIWVSERWGSLSFALQPLASLALSTDAIIIFTFRMLVWLCLKVTKSVYQHLSSSVINTFVCVICEKDKV